MPLIELYRLLLTINENIIPKFQLNRGRDNCKRKQYSLSPSKHKNEKTEILINYLSVKILLKPFKTICKRIKTQT